MSKDTSKELIDIDAGYSSDTETDDTDLQILRVSVPDKPCPNIMGKVHRSRSHRCYICAFTTKMQVTFTNTHPGCRSMFQCDFCPAQFRSCNSLFKHERLHQYMKYKCTLCEYPYQMRTHYKVHSGKGLDKCNVCQCTFACKSSLNAHKETHSTHLVL